MKRVLCLLLAGLLMLPMAAFAETAAEDSAAAGAPETVEEMAEYLHGKGLLQGTGDGYELEKAMNRAEGITMLVRLLGKEAEALNGSYEPGFTDVPAEHWAFAYVMYAKTNEITRGTEEGSFTPDRDMSGQEFLALLLRSLGLDVAEPSNAVELSDALGILPAEVKTAIAGNQFSRGEMVQIAYRTLFAG